MGLIFCDSKSNNQVAKEKEVNMKKRIGFVSNSSSSSFVAFGVAKDSIKLSFSDEECIIRFDEEREYYKKHPNNVYKMDIEKYAKSNDMKIEYAKKNLMDEENYALYERGEFCIGGKDSKYVAIPLETLLNNHTELSLGKIKEYVMIALNKEYGTSFTEKNIFYIEEGWYDG
jgi:hypothetical protein